MSIFIDSHDDPRYTTRGGVYVPAANGPTTWFSGDVYTVRLRASATSGSIGIVEASVPPGSGLVAHTYAHQDETFYIESGELEFYTPGGSEEIFLEGGDRPQPGVQVQPWGPERLDDRMLSLFQKYGVEALLEEE
jgi:hypothetical protein